MDSFNCRRYKVTGVVGFAVAEDFAVFVPAFVVTVVASEVAAAVVDTVLV
ncbi:MAG: hypothetical protein ACR5K2_02830 [Wolbachia sp.]